MKNAGFFQRIRSERGSVLLFALAFGALLAVVIMALSSQVTSAMDSQKSRLLYNEYIELVDSIRAQLNDPFMCASLLSGQTFDAAVVTATTPGQIPLIRTGFGANTAHIVPNWTSKPGGGGVQIGRIEVVKDALYNDTPPKVIYMADTSNPTPYTIAQVIMTLVPNVPRVNMTREYLKIPLTLLLRGTQIHGCHGPNSSAAQCLAIGGAFDWRTGTVPAGLTYPQHRCHPDLRSFYTQKTPPPGPGGEALIVANDEAAAASQCPSPYKPIPVGTFMDGQSRWLCRWENGNRFKH